MTVPPAARPAPPRALELVTRLPLSAALTVSCGLMFAGWLPHYLTWPWWPDIDSFASIAQGWDAGIRPYRDVSIFNFPGQIELLWLLGKVFGWGRTWPIYAVDAAMLIALGIMMSAWSRGHFGRSVPGLVGFIAFLHYYMSLDYKLVAQRDWQGPALVILGLLLVQVRPGHASAAVSGLLTGLAFVIRPHVLLLAPAMALALSTAASPGGEPGRPWWMKSRRSLLPWVVAGCLGAGVGFAPLAIQGILGDFVQGVRQASYGRYGEYPVSLAGRITGQLAEPRLAIGATLAVASTLMAPVPIRKVAIPWLLAMVLALFYRPFHPVQHDYLAHPLWLTWSVNLAVIAGVGMLALKRRPGMTLGLVAMLVVIGSPGLPRYFDMTASVQALGDLRRGTTPARAPLGAEKDFAPLATRSPYTWEQYRQVLDYLRLRTTPSTRVANLLRNVPFPAMNADFRGPENS